MIMIDVEQLSQIWLLATNCTATRLLLQKYRVCLYLHSISEERMPAPLPRAGISPKEIVRWGLSPSRDSGKRTPPLFSGANAAASNRCPSQAITGMVTAFPSAR